MTGDKIDYVRKACRKMIDHLSPRDYAGLVGFSNTVHKLAPIREITQSQKEELKKIVGGIVSRGSTNMSGGLQTALKWINETDFPDNVILRVILFTDGWANVGVRGRDLLEFVINLKDRATVSTFGFGNDCDQELLADISLKAKGNYSFINSPDAAMSAFARELGGLLSTYAQNINVKISPDKNNSINEVLNDEDVSEKDRSVVVSLQDILGEEKKWIVADVCLSEVDKPLPRKVNAFKVCVEYTDRHGEAYSVNDLKVKVEFCKEDEVSDKEDEEVVLHRDRLLAAIAQDKAEEYGRKGNYAGAQQVLNVALSNMSDDRVKKAVSKLVGNYFIQITYSNTRGTSNTTRSLFKGKRLSSKLSNEEEGVFGFAAQSYTAMDLTEDSFNISDSKTTSSDDFNTSAVNNTSDIDNSNTTKTRSGNDW